MIRGMELGLLISLVLALGLAGLGWWRYLSAKTKVQILEEGSKQLKDAFSALSSDALAQNNQAFLHLAESVLGKFQERAKGELEQKEKSIDQMVKPVQESLSKLDQEMRKLELERKGDHAGLRAQVDQLIKSEKLLHSETSNLVKALRAPIVRGRWGELQLKRVVELAGMVNHCDFFEQQQTADGAMRPDMIVHLPGNKQVIVDAKAPLEAYLDAHEMTDEALRHEKLQSHARQVRQHITSLSKKSYWDRFESPEFVVLFLPSETFFSAALEFDPSLIEVGAGQGVILATPTTLIGLLRAVAHGWKQDAISKNTQMISELGHELYKRIYDMTSHFGKVGRALSQSVEAYNKTIGSLESRVLVTARKFQELGSARGDIELKPLEFIEKITRTNDESTPHQYRLGDDDQDGK